MHGQTSRTVVSDYTIRDHLRDQVISRHSRSTSTHQGFCISIVSLSAGIPHRLILTKVGRVLQSETHRSVLLVNFIQTKQSVALEEWQKLYSDVGRQSGISDQLQTIGLNVYLLNVRASPSPLEIGHFLTLLDRAREDFDYVLVQLDNALPVAFLLDCLGYANRSFILSQATLKDFSLRDLILRELRVKVRTDGLKLKTIICTEKGSPKYPDLLQKFGSTVQGYIHECPSAEVAEQIHTWSNRYFNDDIRRLARDIAQRRVGLALSSGGARGLSHIGVIQVLEENGIDIDIVAGCSMGSYVGSVWAFGNDGREMERLAREIECPWGLLKLIDPNLLPRRGFIKGEKIKRRLKQSIGDVHFSELPRPLRIVATHHSTLERTVFSMGEVAMAVHASSAIPGACDPVCINGELYIDGGICDPLPVDVLQELGIERIIAVNTIPTPSYLKCGEEMKRERDAVKGKKPRRAMEFFNRYFNYFASGNILDTIFRSFHGAQIRVAEQSCRQADLVLRPLCWDGRWHDFMHPGKYISIGRREAEEHIEEIKSLVQRKDYPNETVVSSRSMAST